MRWTNQCCSTACCPGRRSRAAAPRESRRARACAGAGGDRSGRNPTLLLTAAGVAWGIYETLQKRAGRRRSGGGTFRVQPAGMGSRRRCRRAPAAAAASRRGAADRAAGDLGGERRRRDERRGARGDPGAGAERPASAIVERSCSSRGRSPRSSPASPTRRSARRSTCWRSPWCAADEQVTGAERIYLAQLANLLGSTRRRCSARRRTPASASTRSAIDAGGTA